MRLTSRRYFEILTAAILLLLALKLTFTKLKSENRLGSPNSRTEKSWRWDRTAEGPRHPAKSTRNHPLNPRAPTGADHVRIAKALIAQSSLAEARAHLEIAIALDGGTNNEAQFLQDSLSPSFRPIRIGAGAESPFWKIQLEDLDRPIVEIPSAFPSHSLISNTPG